MKPENLIDAMGLLDDDIIESAEKNRSLKKNPFLIKWLSLAACIVLAVLVCVPLFNRPDLIHPPVETLPPETEQNEWALPPSVLLNGNKYIISANGVSFATCPEGFEKAGTITDGEFDGMDYYTNPDVPEWIYVYTGVNSPGAVKEFQNAFMRLVLTDVREWYIRYNGQLYVNPSSYIKRSELPDSFSEVGTTLFEGYDTIPYENLGSNRFRQHGSTVYASPDVPGVIYATFSVDDFAVYYACDDLFKPHPNYRIYENGAGVVKHVYKDTVKIDVGSGEEVFRDFTITPDTELSDGMPGVGDIVEFSYKDYPTSDYRPLTALKIRTAEAPAETPADWDLPPHIIVDGAFYFEHGAESDLPEGYELAGYVPDGDYKGDSYYVNPDKPEWIYAYVHHFENIDIYARFVHELADEQLIRYDGKLYTSNSLSNYVYIDPEEKERLNEKFGYNHSENAAEGFVEAGTAVFEEQYTIPHKNFGSNCFQNKSIYVNPDEPDIILIADKALQENRSSDYPKDFGVCYLCADYLCFER